MTNKWTNLLSWYNAEKGLKPSFPDICETRDVFQARLDGFFRQLINNHVPLNDASLLVAITGEIGNNSYDHNIGHWKDRPGCWFEFTINDHSIYIAIADRGQGIWNSLKSVDPALDSPQKAIEAAFERIISGRHPEDRGNGLKFVRSVINCQKPRGLVCFSDSGSVHFGMNGQAVKSEIFKNLPVPLSTQGTLMLIDWKFS